MSSRDSRAEYERRMHKVLEHIDRHLDQPLVLATLADVAHFSPFHFHRLFAAWMGETLGDYLRRTGAYGEPLLRFWQEDVYPWLARDGLLGQPRYGIGHDDPGVTEPDRCRYDACAEVAPQYRPSGGVLTTTIPGGRYAVLHFRGVGRRSARSLEPVTARLATVQRHAARCAPVFRVLPEGLAV